MPTFSYKALKPDGKMAEGVLEAGGRPEALRQIETLGLRPVNVAEKAGPGKNKAGATEAAGSLHFNFASKKFPPRSWRRSPGCCPVCWRRACR